MAPITLNLDDALDAELNEYCARLGRSKTEVILEMIQQRAHRERALKRMADPAVIAETKRLWDAGLLECDPHEYDDLLKEVARP